MFHLTKLKSPLFKIIFISMLALWIGSFITIQKVFNLFLVSHLLLSLLALTLTLFAFIPWYGRNYKGLGIEDHFEKILAVMTYLMIFDSALILMGLQSFVVEILLNIIFIIFLFVNITLLRYHLNDSDTTPPAYFAANLYLKDLDEEQKK